jgi:intracellular multiplication protein IcmE
MKDAGYTAKELRNAGFTAAELKNAGFSAKDLKDAGFSAKELKDAGFSAKDLKDAGFSAKDLKDAGFSAKELKDAGFNAKELKDAGFSAQDLKDAGFSAAELKAAGFSAAELKAAGFTPAELKAAGFTAAELKAAGFGADELQKGGFTLQDLRNAGFNTESQVAGLDALTLQQQTSSVPGGPRLTPQEAQAAANSQQLQSILDKQNQQAAEQKYQQKIQQKTSEMLSAANQSIQAWKAVATQVYTAGNEEEAKNAGAQGNATLITNTNNTTTIVSAETGRGRQKTVIKTGDILFAVMDTAVNSDEPGPILATIVSGKLKGSKLIGSFNLPSNADKLVITFNTLSVPGLDKTISVSAYAIDPNTARTALSSRTNHHYMMRYGSMFAASFLQGFGNAFQSANTQVTIGGTGGGNNITVSNGIGRSTLENAVIGLATVGKAWGQQAQQIFNTPTTVQVYSGTGLGVLFTQDVKIA